MLVTDYLNEDFRIVSNNETKAFALDFLNLNNLSHIPIFEKGIFLGNISKENVEELLNKNSELNNVQNSDIEVFSLLNSATIFDALQLFYRHQTNMIPVFDEHLFLGIITSEDVIEALNKFPFFLDQAAIMIVRIPTKRYSLNEVTKIIESNNAMTLGVVVYKLNNEFADILIKVISENLASLGETFERFGYTIVEKYFTDEKEIFIKDRYDHFMKYLNI